VTCGVVADNEKREKKGRG